MTTGMESGLTPLAQTAVSDRAAPTARHTTDPMKARQVAEDFESFFLSQALQPMFANLSPESPFGGGMAEDMWRSLQVEEYAKAITKNGGIGIADAVMREMLQAQEAR